MRKTTKKEFADYKKWCKYYMDKFGLNDWTMYFVHEDLDGAVAQCRSNIICRGVTFALASEVEYELDVRETARHEVCHILIADLSQLVGTYTTKDEASRADEALACRLTVLLDDTK